MKSRVTTGAIYKMNIFNHDDDKKRLESDVDKIYPGDPYDDVIYMEAQRLFELSFLQAEKIRKELNMFY